ncbi:hypothetical protein CERSUDRAFT_104245 [Gelatoporia subvermispora B]|uniref:F-box only protein 9 n=1 Tax=Ceriporiopsis subvermispora (strain B) TaxID=914234 RepID=M2RJK0_CERS8|nr:hypothetical protein CERSUDRAFT_104245 [Gelatoporia subvermispora B]
MSVSSPGTAPDSDELARFREQWKAEVRKKKGQPVAQTVVGPSTSPRSLPRPRAFSGATTSVSRPVVTDNSAEPLNRKLRAAIDLYRRAVQCEQQSNLDEALRLYRQAFRMDANVDRAFHRLETQQLAASAAGHAPDSAGAPTRKHQKAPSITGQDAVDAITRSIKAMDMHSSVLPDMSVTVTRSLASLVKTWSYDVSFEPEDEREPVPIKLLPDELLVHILRTLDVSSIERFAAVNRKARVVSLDTSIWKDFVCAVYKPPQINDDESLDDLLRNYMSDYRRLYIEHPRVRLDGVYIAVCHYIRNGLSENTWVHVSHLITYHRYLRFYPNGQVLSLLANEEHSPQQVIPLLKPTLRMKGLFIGNWNLVGNTLYITDLADPVQRPDGVAGPRYTFQMILELRSRPLGRWNRLDLHTYDSVDIESGEATPLPLKHQRPFWFSKVRSYA